jgi:serine/threonine protein kinase
VKRERLIADESGRKLLNRFVLQEKIGSGGMGDVYKALDLRQVEAEEEYPYLAIKLLNPDFAQRDDAFIALQRETSRTRRIASEHIVQVYDFDRDGDISFMGMELLNGRSIDEFIIRHPDGVPREEALNIINGFCEGLIAAHAQDIIHSDIKPGNIFYTSDGNVKLLDFGLARAVQNPGTAAPGHTQTVFDPGGLGALTPAYASLDMLTGEPASKSCDVFAAALVAYEILTGVHPFNRVSAEEANAQGLQPERIKSLNHIQWRAIKKALALQSAHRTVTIEEFRTAMLKESMLETVRRHISSLFGR